MSGATETTAERGAPRAEHTVALMQPTFLPWVGYFALMDAVDELVLLDDFQFVRQSFHHRNRAFVPGAARVSWMTVPVPHLGSGETRTIREVALPDFARFAKKLTSTLAQAYAKSPYAKAPLGELEELLARAPVNLAELNVRLLRWQASRFGIETRLSLSSEIESGGRRSERVASILRAVRASRYHAARGAAAYMQLDGVFPLEDVRTSFQSYVPEPYAQVQSTEFVPYLSALDLLLQTPAQDALDTIRRGARPFVPWEEMPDHTDQADSNLDPTET